MIRIINNIDGFRALEDDWQRLWGRCADATPFQRFEYVLSAAEFHNEIGKLYILVVHDNGNGSIIAIVPTILESDGCLKFINARHTDFCCIIVDEEYNNYNLYEELADFLQHDEKIKFVCFENLKRENLLQSALKPFIKTCFVQDYNYYSYITVSRKEGDSDFVDSFRFVNGKRKKKLRKLHKTTFDTCEFSLLNIKKGDSFPHEIVTSLVTKMISTGIRKEEYFSEAMLLWWKRLYDSGLLSLAILKKNDEPLSCNFVFWDEKRKEYIKWIMLYEDGKHNNTISVEIANYLYEKGETVNINFARGIYGYKMENFHPIVLPLYRLLITKTMWSHIKAICCMTIHNMKPVVKHYLKKK